MVGNAVVLKPTVTSVMIQFLGESDQHMRKENTLAPCPGNRRVRLWARCKVLGQKYFTWFFGVVCQAALVSLSLALTGRVWISVAWIAAQMGKIGHDKKRLVRGLQAERQSNQEENGKSRKASTKWERENKGDEEVQWRIAFLSQVL